MSRFFLAVYQLRPAGMVQTIMQSQIVELSGHLPKDRDDWQATIKMMTGPLTKDDIDCTLISLTELPK